LSLSSYFLSPVQLRRGIDRVNLVGSWNLSGSNQNNIYGRNRYYIPSYGRVNRIFQNKY